MRQMGILNSYVGRRFQLVVKANEWSFCSMHSVHNMDCEMNQCCRICAKQTSAFISVFGEEGLFRQLMLKLKYCLQIIVLEQDDLPTTVCWNCVAKLEVCYELIQECVQGQNVFRRQIFNHHIPLNWQETEVKMDYSDPQKLAAVEQEHVYGKYQDSTSSSECQPHHSEQCRCEQCVFQCEGLSLLAEVIDKSKDVGDVSCSGPSRVTSDENKRNYLQANAESKQETNEGEKQIRQTKKTVCCEFCGKVFSHTGDLNKHRRRHTGERPYPCPQCTKCFSHASNLLRHQKIHSGETPYQCPTCARRFGRKDKMVNHIKNSHCKPNSEAHTSA